MGMNRISVDGNSAAYLGSTMSDEQYVSLEEAGKMLGLHSNAIRERLANGKLKGDRVGPSKKLQVLVASILEYQRLYAPRPKGARTGHLGKGDFKARTYNLSMTQVRNLWQIYQSLALASDAIKDEMVVASATKLQELLFSIPMSDLANPKKDVPDGEVNNLRLMW